MAVTCLRRTVGSGAEERDASWSELKLPVTIGGADELQHSRYKVLFECGIE